MSALSRVFGKGKNLIGMIHVDALPGTPQHKISVNEIVAKGCREVETYMKYNFGAILIENMHDVPYIRHTDFQPEVVSCMSRICTEIKSIIPSTVVCGVQVLSGGNKEALAIAKACSLDFIRVEGYVFGHIGDEGYINANAGNLLRYRRQIEAENVLVFTDIKKKHSSHAITNDVSVVETAKAAQFFLSDAIILTGTATGSPVDKEELTEVKSNCDLPILIGSGITADNLEDYWSADGFIVGSYLKEHSFWGNDLDEVKMQKLIEKYESLSGNKITHQTA